MAEAGFYFTGKLRNTPVALSRLTLDCCRIGQQKNSGVLISRLQFFCLSIIIKSGDVLNYKPQHKQGRLNFFAIRINECTHQGSA
jgi:hypothetical protein